MIPRNTSKDIDIVLFQMKIERRKNQYLNIGDFEFKYTK